MSLYDIMNLPVGHPLAVFWDQPCHPPAVFWDQPCLPICRKPTALFVSWNYS